MLRIKAVTHLRPGNTGIFLILLSVLMPALLQAQGRPDIVWMRGGQGGGVGTLAWSPDGKILAQGGGGFIKLWRVADRTLLRTINAVATVYYVRQMAFAPDGQTLAVASAESSSTHSLKMWRVSDGTLLRTAIGAGSVWSVSYSKDGQIVATGDEVGNVRLWSASDFSLIRTLPAAGIITSVPFSPDGQTLASAGGERHIRIWRISDGALLRTIPEAHPREINDLAYSPNGQMLASVSEGDSENARLWRVSDGMLLHELVGHPGWVWNVAFAPDGQRVVTGGGDKIFFWRASDGILLHSVAAEYEAAGWDYAQPLAFSPDGAMLAAGERGVNLRNPSTGELIQPMADLTGTPIYSPDGQMLVTANSSPPYTTTLWRASDGKRLRVLPVEGVVAAFSPDSQTLAVSSFGPSYVITLWRVSDGALLRTMDPGHTNRVRSLAFTPDGQTLASGSLDNTIKLSRVSDGAFLRTLNGHSNTVRVLVVTPDGQTLASGSTDRTIKLWRISDGALLRTLNGHAGTVTSLAITSDGQTLTSGSSDRTIKLWRISDGAPLRTITVSSQGNGVQSVAFSLDNQIVASGHALSADASIEHEAPIQFWRVSDGALLQSYNQETSRSVSTLQFSPDGRRLVYLRQDDNVMVVAKNPFGPPSYAVSGMITLEELVPDASPQPLDLTFRPANNGTPLIYSLTVGPDDLFSVLALPNASYTLHIKGSKWLAKNIAVDTSNGDVNNISVLLLSGDSNDDNSVDVLDLDALIQAFDSTVGTPNWNNGVADFNCDGSVDVLDLDILLRNFDRTGDS